MNALAEIQRQVMWNRLIAVVEEQAQTMIRTAFSTTVREAGDLSAGIFDLQGRMLAQAVTGTPGDTTIDLSWSAPSSDGGSPITGYRITPSIAGSAQTPVDVTGTDPSARITGLTNGTAYTFTVAATNSAAAPCATIRSTGTRSSSATSRGTRSIESSR